MDAPFRSRLGADHSGIHRGKLEVLMRGQDELGRSGARYNCLSQTGFVPSAKALLCLLIAVCRGG